ncbi:MAG: DnaD domain protein [Bacillota bacterium]|nr:DnaD domain protein [Bacillota bacterium]
MEIRALRRRLYSDLHLPAVFVTDYLPDLSLDAVRAYLTLSLLTQEGEERVEPASLLRMLRLDDDAFAAVLIELTNAGLINYVQGQPYLTLVDIKDQQVLKLFRPRTGSRQDDLMDHYEHDEGYRRLSEDINNRFFSGMMGIKWFDVLEVFYSEYRFEPQVIYVLFNLCRDLNKLRVGYVQAVGRDWHQNGVVSYEDMNRHLARHEREAQLLKRIGRRLRIDTTEYHRPFVDRWLNEFGFDEDIIELALERVVKLRSPSFPFFDRLLREWHEAGLESVEAIEAYEKEREQQLRSSRQSSRTQSPTTRPQPADRRAGGNVAANFDQRSYSDEFLRDFYADPMRLGELRRSEEKEEKERRGET